MKKSILKCSAIIICLCSSFNAYSQTDKGKLLVGGQYGLNFSSYTSTFKGVNNSFENGKYRTLEISPQVGYFIFKNVPVGIDLIYNHSKTTLQSSDSRSSSLALMPFVRYYFGQAKLKPYLHISAGPGWEKTGSANFGWPEIIQKSKLFRYQLRGGLSAFFNDFISFDFSFGYKSNTQFFKEPMVDGTFTEWKVINNGLDAVIGVVVYL
jgi:outer membrane protein